jgi:hypothetical protein
MAATTLYQELEDILTNRMKNALRTGEIVNAPDWVTDIAEVLALPICMVDAKDIPELRHFAHDELDRFIEARLAEKRAEGNS